MATTTTYLHPHEAEEFHFATSARMWDATPGVCCAYFQTGACAHTEAANYDYDDDLEPVETGADEVVYAVETEDDEPF